MQKLPLKRYGEVLLHTFHFMHLISYFSLHTFHSILFTPHFKDSQGKSGKVREFYLKLEESQESHEFLPYMQMNSLVPNYNSTHCTQCLIFFVPV